MIAIVTGWLASRWWGRRGGIVIGAVVFSHWILDLIVHRHDMPIFPGNAGDIRVGFGLWEAHGWAIAAEAALIVIGAFLYRRAATDVETAAGARPQVLTVDVLLG